MFCIRFAAAQLNGVLTAVPGWLVPAAHSVSLFSESREGLVFTKYGETLCLEAGFSSNAPPWPAAFEAQDMPGTFNPADIAAA